jgi:acetylornithine deacetylase/succinyl-diaminopimelate desuccinylase-like protein
LEKIYGVEPEPSSVAKPKGAYAGFSELHIEQGPLLDRAGIGTGVVEGIAAPATLRVQITGESGHAGAVLMPDRYDALLAGAEIALAVERQLEKVIPATPSPQPGFSVPNPGQLIVSLSGQT